MLDTRPAATRADVEAVTGYRRTRAVSGAAFEQTEDVESLNPTELIDQGIKQIQADVAGELLARLMTKSPTFFEQTVVDLLVAMGYGSAEGQARVTSASNDGGIDGIIDQDTLGLSRVYIQSKRYSPDNAVGRPEVHGFVGALSGKADGGVFITTGRFSAGAADYAAAVPTRVILIDGDRISSLMIRFGIGVQTKQTVQIVELDEEKRGVPLEGFECEIEHNAQVLRGEYSVRFRGITRIFIGSRTSYNVRKQVSTCSSRAKCGQIGADSRGAQRMPEVRYRLIWAM